MSGIHSHMGNTKIRTKKTQISENMTQVNAGDLIAFYCSFHALIIIIIIIIKSVVPLGT
jgi:hypothetical protein